MCRFVGQEISLKSSHLALVESWRILAAPQIPYIVNGKILFFVVLVCKIGCAYQLSHFVQQFLTLVFSVTYADLFQTSVFVERHRSVEQQVGVAYIIHASVSEQTLHMFAQFLAPCK